MTQCPILPCTFSVKNRIIFKSWDRFVLPLPFGKGMIIWGTPVTVAADADDDMIEKHRRQIETEMNQLLAKADHALGLTPIKPADPK